MTQYLTSREAAERLGITVRAVHKLHQRGTLRAITFGQALAFTRADVDRARSRPKRGRPKGLSTASRGD
jgi:excisionase family DNA binding protein